MLSPCHTCKPQRHLSNGPETASEAVKGTRACAFHLVLETEDQFKLCLCGVCRNLIFWMQVNRDLFCQQNFCRIHQPDIPQGPINATSSQSTDSAAETLGVQVPAQHLSSQHCWKHLEFVPHAQAPVLPHTPSPSGSALLPATECSAAIPSAQSSSCLRRKLAASLTFPACCTAF